MYNPFALLKELDCRMDIDNLPIPFFQNKEIRKDYIKNPDSYKPKDYLINYFYAKPDYESPEKLKYLGLLGLKMGTCSGVLKIIGDKITTTNQAMLALGKHCTALTLGTLTYGAVTISLANIRGKKDDLWNHFFGGSSIGFIYTYYLKSAAKGAQLGLFFGCTTLALRWFNKRKDVAFIPSNLHTLRENSFMIGTVDLRLKRDEGDNVRKYHYKL